MWIKEDGKLKYKKHYVTSTGGQCLMSPPEITDGKMPYALYLLGGCLFNIAFSVIFLGLYLFFRNVPYFSAFLLYLSVCGFAFALLNGVPMRRGMIDNDGYSTLALGKNDKALWAFWVQLKVTGQLAQGVRLKDMPEEWFFVPLPEEMNNSIVATIGVLACNRLMDKHSFMEADQLMDNYLTKDSAIVGLHRHFLVCDRIYCELIAGNRQDRLIEMLDKQQKKFMKSMKNSPSVQRTKYSYMLLAKKNIKKADKIKEQFEKRSRSYPYPSDIVSELELIGIADCISEKGAIDVLSRIN